MSDLVIKGGLVFDGLGNAPQTRDLRLRDGKIAAVGTSLASEDADEVDASGLWVLPGFLDIHTHYDLEVEFNPGLQESVRHGVTTAVMGHCSLSVTVGKAEDLAHMFRRVESLPEPLVNRWLSQALSWDSPEAYLDHLASLPLGPNVVPMLGHSALRAWVMGLERSLSEAKPTPEELASMDALARRCLKAGCRGISVDQVPWHMMTGPYRGRTLPSQHASWAELRMLANACRDFDAVFQATPNPREPLSFLRLLGLGVALDRRPLRLMMLTALDLDHVPGLWKIFPLATAVVNRLLGGNMRFQTLAEPFSVQAEGPITPLFEEFPAGVQLNDQSTPEERRILWKDPVFRKAFAKQWTGKWGRTFHRDLYRMEVLEAPEPSMIGRSLGDLADEVGKAPVDHFMDLLERFDTELVWNTSGANTRPGPRRRMLAHPHILPGFSDAGAHVRHMGYYDGALTLLKEAHQSGCMSMERAVARVTGEPAAWYRLDRGTLEPGAVADLLLLDPAGLSEPSAPHVRQRDPLLDGTVRCVKRGSDGLIKAVWVRGQLAWREGAPALELGRQAMGESLRLPEPVTDPRYAVDVQVTPHRLGHYWDVFLLKHQNPANVALHFAGALLFYAVLGFTWLMHNPWLLALLPLSQLTGLVGHRLFERSPIDRQDAIFSLRATLSLNRMMLAVFSGRYFREVARAKTAWGVR